MNTLIRKYKIHKLIPVLTTEVYNEITSILEFYSTLIKEDESESNDINRNIFVTSGKKSEIILLYLNHTKKLYLFQCKYNMLSEFNNTEEDYRRIRLMVNLFEYKYDKKVSNAILKTGFGAYARTIEII